MQLIITLRKDVEDPDEGRQIYDWVKQKLEDRPDVKINGHVTNHFVDELEDPPT